MEDNDLEEASGEEFDPQKDISEIQEAIEIGKENIEYISYRDCRSSWQGIMKGLSVKIQKISKVKTINHPTAYY